MLYAGSRTFSSLLSLPKKRGRPRLPSWDDILPWPQILSADELAHCDALSFWWRWERRGGRPPDQARNQSLREAICDGRRQGMTMRASARKYYKQKHNGRDPTHEQLVTIERQMARLLKNNF